MFAGSTSVRSAHQRTYIDLLRRRPERPPRRMSAAQGARAPSPDEHHS